MSDFYERSIYGTKRKFAVLNGQSHALSAVSWEAAMEYQKSVLSSNSNELCVSSSRALTEYSGPKAAVCVETFKVAWSYR